MKCQACDNDHLVSFISLGYLPPPNYLQPISTKVEAQTWLPTDLLYCNQCELVQMEYVPKANLVFPPSYAYTSGTTKILRDNFADLAKQVQSRFSLKPGAVIVDIGANDGTLLSNFPAQIRIAVEPTNVVELAKEHSTATYQRFFNPYTSGDIEESWGKADVITCANCFAHIDGLADVITGVRNLLAPNGVFISESHYLMDLLQSLQYDTIYHEHLRFYSLTSLRNALARGGLEVFAVEQIPTHGGSIRVYAQHRGFPRPVEDSVGTLLAKEPVAEQLQVHLEKFAKDVVLSKLNLLSACYEIKRRGARICGISAPSRAATVINYCKLGADVIDYIVEVEGSLKIGHYAPGTTIPIINESKLFEDQPDYAILFSWHIAEELIPKLRAKGYRGGFIFPCERGTVSKSGLIREKATA